MYLVSYIYVFVSYLQQNQLTYGDIIKVEEEEWVPDIRGES